MPDRDAPQWGRHPAADLATASFGLDAIPGWTINVSLSSLPLRREVQRTQAVLFACALGAVIATILASSLLAGAAARRLDGVLESVREGGATPSMPLVEFDLLGAWVDRARANLRQERRTSDAFRARLEAFEAMAPVITYVAEDAPAKAMQVLAFGPSIRRVLKVEPDTALVDDWLPANIHPDDKAKVVAAFGDGVGASGLSRAIYRLRGGDGRYHWFLDTRVRLARGDGSRLVHGLMLEITDQKEAEHQLIQAAKLAQVGELAISLGHELSQPLNVIALATSNLLAVSSEHVPDRDHLVTRLERIARQVDRASALISHLKVFGRHEISEGSEAFELARVVGDALLVMRGTLAATSIEVQVSRDMPGIAARGRPILVEQALVNLLSNAASVIGQRLEREPGFVGRISIRISAVEPGLVGIVVADNGGGVPPEAADRIFEPFFTTKPPGKGTGLGLSISRRVLREMGGDLVFANDGEGAKFSIKLQAA